MRVIAVHLLNDFSGSPKVLMQLLKGFAKNDIETHLYTCGTREGFLTNIPNVNHHTYWYEFKNNPVLRLIFLMTSQLLLGLKLLFFLKRKDIVYVNTVLPFGAAIIGRIRGCKVIYHIHETTMKPQILKKFLFGIVKITANEVVYVSKFLSQQEPIKVKSHVLYNVLEKEFIEAILPPLDKETKPKIIVMICSLKKYKGVDEFYQIAKLNPQFIFKLVVNATQFEINEYFKSFSIPANLIIYPTQKNTHPFYQEASILVNLSNPKTWVETFGLTVLEGMAYALPVIVPPVGGVTELVEENENGFLIDSQDYIEISKKINEILNDKSFYKRLSLKSKEKSKLFEEEIFEKESLRIVNSI